MGLGRRQTACTVEAPHDAAADVAPNRPLNEGDAALSDLDRQVESALAAVEQKLAAWLETATRQQTGLAEWESRLGEQQAQLVEQQAQLARDQAELTERQARLTRSTEELEERGRALAGGEAELAERMAAAAAAAEKAKAAAFEPPPAIRRAEPSEPAAVVAEMAEPGPTDDQPVSAADAAPEAVIEASPEVNEEPPAADEASGLEDEVGPAPEDALEGQPSAPASDQPPTAEGRKSKGQGTVGKVEPPPPGRADQGRDDSEEASPTAADDRSSKPTTERPKTKAAPEPPEPKTAVPDSPSLDLDPETAAKLRVLRRLSGPGRSDAELLAQLQNRTASPQTAEKPKKRWWKR